MNSHLPVPFAPPPPTPTPAAQDIPSINFSGFIATLLRRKWIVFGVMVAFLVLAFAYLKVTPRVYEATGTIEVRAESLKVTMIDPVASEDLSSVDALKTVESSLMSTTLVKQMIENHNLDRYMEGSMSGMIYQILGSSAIELIRGTRLVGISFRSTHPEFAKEVVDAYITEYRKFENSRSASVTQMARERLRESSERLAENLAQSQQALEEFKSQHVGFSLGQDENPVDNGLRTLSARWNEAKATRIQLEADLELLGTSGDAVETDRLLNVASIAQLPEVRDLRVKLSEAEADFETVKQEYKYKHPKYKAAEKRIEELTRSLNDLVSTARSSLERAYQAAKDAEEKLNLVVNQQEEMSSERDRALDTYKSLLTKVESDEAILKSVVTRLKETEVSLGFDFSNIEVIQEAMIPDHPIWPDKRFVVAAGLLGGMIAGVALAMALELLDRRIRTNDDVAALLPGVPCLAKLPKERIKTHEDRMIFVNDPQSVSAEAFRNLRTSLYFADGVREKRSIMFTSSQPGEGKSYCALNCASSFAMQGQQTLLIDADLRRPSLEETLLNGNNRGLTSYLQGRAEPQEICYPTHVRNLYFVPAGDLRSNPSEMLANPRFKELLIKAYECFDKIVIDCPPLDPVSDALLISHYVDALCLVIRAKSSTKEQLQRTVYRIAETGRPPTGYVLNGADKDEFNSYASYRNVFPTGTETPAYSAFSAQTRIISDRAAII